MKNHFFTPLSKFLAKLLIISVFFSNFSFAQEYKSVEEFVSKLDTKAIKSGALLNKTPIPENLPQQLRRVKKKRLPAKVFF